jgi:hypothetical protein
MDLDHWLAAAADAIGDWKRTFGPYNPCGSALTLSLAVILASRPTGTTPGILRSVLMKAEHEAFVPELHTGVERLTRRRISNSSASGAAGCRSAARQASGLSSP